MTTKDEKNDDKAGCDRDAKPDREEKAQRIEPVAKPIGEAGDNLRRRAEWFERRTGKS